jgi:glutamate-1-semialdehyde 2,1-aminomutase
MRDYSQSKALYERARKVLAGGVSSEFRKFSYPHPLFYVRGVGSRVYDVDGNEYLDFTLSQGPLILGHSHPDVLEAVQQQSAKAQILAGQHLQEVELAEKLQRLIPCAEQLRFGLSGSESVHAALRLARAVTGRPKFLRFEGHYHGWLDNVAFSITATSLEELGERKQPHPVPWTQGLPPLAKEESLILPWNDLTLVERTLAERSPEIAAIITEPVMCNNGCIPPEPGFLEGLRALCDQYGCLLIFDEVITGFRLGMGGAQAFFGVTPDLAIFGKAIANGYPISVFAGRQQWMQWVADGKVIHAGTMNSGNPSVAAALATLEVLVRDQVHSKLFVLGQRLMEGLNQAAQEAQLTVLIQGPGPMFHMGFTAREKVRDFRETLDYDKAAYAQFVGEMHERGIRLIGRGLWYISGAHTEEDIERTIETAREVLQGMSR